MSAERSLRQLLDDVAARTPAPGGGSATAWSCALAASLVEMAAVFAPRDDDHPDRDARMNEIADRARSLRAAALELGERELHAYAPVLTALRLPKDEPGRAGRLDAALSEAAGTPFELAQVGAELAELAVEAADAGSPHVRGDAITAALLADGACQAAARLAQINLAGRPDDPRLSALAELTASAAAARDEALR